MYPPTEVNVKKTNKEHGTVEDKSESPYMSCKPLLHC